MIDGHNSLEHPHRSVTEKQFILTQLPLLIWLMHRKSVHYYFHQHYFIKRPYQSICRVIATFYYFCIKKHRCRTCAFCDCQKELLGNRCVISTCKCREIKNMFSSWDIRVDLRLLCHILQSGCLPQFWLCFAFWLVKLIQSIRNWTWAWCK